MTTVEDLDKGKQYVICCINNSGLVANLIKKFSLDEAKSGDIKSNDISCHVAILYFKNGVATIAESHLDTHGVHEIEFNKWKNRYLKQKLLIAECELNMEQVKYDIDFHTPYSLTQIGKDAINDGDFWNDSSGKVCSEYFASSEKGFKTCYKLNKPTYKIKPIDIQVVYKDSLEELNVQG